MKISFILTTVILALLISGCGSKPSPSADKKAEPAKTPAAAPTATATPTKTEPTKTPAPETVKAKDPDEFVKQFMKVYQEGNKAEVQKYVSESVMKKLRFGNGPIEDLYFQGCNDEGGTINCAYQYGGGYMALTIKGTAASGYQITGYEENAD